MSRVEQSPVVRKIADPVGDHFEILITGQEQERAKELFSFSKPDQAGRKGYTIVVCESATLISQFNLFASMVSRGLIERTYGLGEDDCAQCPLNRDNNLDRSQELLHGFLAILLIDVFKGFYRDGKQVPWEFKDAYQECLKKINHCEPLETQTPLF